MVAWRRDFHMHPELGFQERRSAGVVGDRLRELGYRVETGVAKPGIVALLEGQLNGLVVMVRFDMDALLIAEGNETDYVSRNPGVTHACGHDGHMAMGLGVATLMSQLRDEMTGVVNHNPRFDFDESAFPLGVAVMTKALAHYLWGRAEGRR